MTNTFEILVLQLLARILYKLCYEGRQATGADEALQRVVKTYVDSSL